MAEHVRQHIVPQLHLRHFVGQTPPNHLWTYDKVDGRRWSASTRDTAVERHFYSYERDDGSMDVTIESFFADEVEGKAAPVYEALLAGEIPVDQPRADYSYFLAAMYVRTQAMRRLAAEFYGQQLQLRTYATAMHDAAFASAVRRAETGRGETMADDVRAKVRELMLDPSKYVLEIDKTPALRMLGTADKLAPMLFEMHWSVIRANEGYFITSDQPVCRRCDQASVHPIFGHGGFHNPTVEVTFPLSPKAVLLMMRRKGIGTHLIANRQAVAAFNNTRAAHAERHLYAHVEDQRVARLAATHRKSRQRIKLEGFGPKKYAETRIRRRRSAEAS